MRQGPQALGPGREQAPYLFLLLAEPVDRIVHRQEGVGPLGHEASERPQRSPQPPIRQAPSQKPSRRRHLGRALEAEGERERQGQRARPQAPPIPGFAALTHSARGWVPSSLSPFSVGGG